MGEGWFNHLIVDDQQKFLETTVLKCRQTQQPTVQLIDKNIYANMKFIYSEKAIKFCEIFPLLLIVVNTVKSKGKISQNFVAFSEYMHFNMWGYKGF